MKRKAILSISLLLGLYGLAICAPGFRPKQLKDSIAPIVLNIGLSFAVYFLAMGLLVPAAARVRKLGFTHTTFAAFFACLSVLFTADVVVGAGLQLEEAAIWLVRVLYVVIAIWGLSSRSTVKGLAEGFRKKARLLWNGLGGWWWKAYLVVVVFFFVREGLHLYVTRGLPFAPTGDEAVWWFPMAHKLMHQGMLSTMKTIGYTPGVSWLNALPARLLGVDRDDWLFVYPFFILCGFPLLVLELAETSLGLLAATSVLFFTFIFSHDLLHHFAGTLNGESIATLLTAILTAEVYLQLASPRKSDARFLRFVLGLGVCVSYFTLSKAPISVLMPFFVLGAVGWLLCQKRPWNTRLVGAGVFVVVAMTANVLWKHRLASVGVFLDNTPPTVREFLATGVDLSGPARILGGLFGYRPFQAGYAYGLLAVIALLAIQGNRLVALVLGGLMAVYWGFVLTLYATLWQHGDYSSAGRYLAHSAIACMLLLPLAFGRTAARSR